MATDILGLDELAENQSAKYLTHNTALRQLEGMSVRVLSRTNSGPPVSPSNGDVYIVDSATGDWSTYSVNDIAHYYASAWHAYTPINGMMIPCVDEDAILYLDSGSWTVFSGGISNIADANDVTVTSITDGQVLAWDSGLSDFVNITLPGASGLTNFAEIEVSGQDTVTAASAGDAVEFVAGTGMTLTTNNTTKTVTFASTGGGGSGVTSFGTVAVSGQSSIVADQYNDTLTVVAGSGITLETNGTTDTLTINSTGGGGGNWTLVDTITETTTFSETVTWNSSWERCRIEMFVKSGDDTNPPYVYFNSDTTSSNYTRSYMAIDGSTETGISGTALRFLLGYYDSDRSGFCTADLWLPSDSSVRKFAVCDVTQYDTTNTDYHYQRYSSVWNNTTATVSSMTFAGGADSDVVIKVYRFTD